MTISGIKSVDFLITAIGEGVVNHNGSFTAYNPASKDDPWVKNHMFPKMRGLDPMQRIPKGDNTMTFSLNDPEIANAKLIVSAECIRSQLFKDVSFGLREVTTENVVDVLASLHGLVRGYLIAMKKGDSFPRKSCLYVTDFECAKPDLAFNQGSNAKVRNTQSQKTSLYSYFKTGKDLHYTGKASLSIEDLQFIPMDNSLGRSAIGQPISIEKGENVAKKITQFLVDIAPSDSAPQARFVKKAVRKGSISKVGEAGIVLNDDAIRIVVAQVRELMESLCVRQGKGYLQVTNVLVDFNNGGRVFRSEADPTLADAQGSAPFAIYYAEENMTDAEYAAAQKALVDEKKAREDAKEAAKAEKVDKRKVVAKEADADGVNQS